MEFTGEKKELFDNAYTAYKEISDMLLDLYSEQNELTKTILKEFDDIEFPKANTDLYIQINLFKIANVDGKISEEEKHFITSIIDNLSELKKIPLYRAFISNMTLENCEKLSKEFGYDEHEIPVIAIMLGLRDESQGSSLVFDVIDKFETIFNSFALIMGEGKEKGIVLCKDEITKLKEYFKSQGLTQTVSSATVDSNENMDLESLLNELNSLIGLDGVKTDVNSTINLIKVNEMRQKKGLGKAAVSSHLVFLGNPGTGKTTVARLLAKIYKELGVVSKGQLIETDRAGLVAGYVGQTALKTTEVVKKAIGGVLFIDEAYSLTSSDSNNDYGSEAIDTLVKLMEDNRDDLIVIVAGYTNQMHKFIDSNPGLSSRFNRYFTFDDYSDEELLEIFKSICKKDGFIASESAIRELRQMLTNIRDKEQFGNARGIRNVFDKAIMNQANRLVKLNNINNADLTTIIASDLPVIEIGLREQ